MADVIAEFIAALRYDVDTKELDEATKKAKEAADKSAKAWNSFGTSVRNVGLAALGAVGSVAALVSKSAASAAAIDDVANRTGAATRDLQRLAFAAQKAGAANGLGAVESALKALDVQLVKGAKDTGPAAEALRALGLSTTELIDLPAEAKFEAIADALAKVENPALQTQIALKLFGGAGQELVPLLAEGSAGIKRMGDEAERLGVVLDEGAVKAAADFDDQLEAVKAQVGAVGRDIGIALIPVVQESIKHWKEWALAVGALGLALGGAKLAQLPGQIGLAANSMASLAMRTTGAVTAALALGVALGTALDQALGLSDAIAGVDQSEARRGAPAQLSSLTADERSRMDDLIAKRDRAQAAADESVGMFRTDAMEVVNKHQAEIDAINARGRVRERGIERLGKSREGVTSFAGRAAGEAAIAAGGKAVERTNALARDAGKTKSKSKGGGKTKTDEIDIAPADAKFGDELRRLAARNGIGEVAIAAALKAGASSLAEGATDFVARNAALSRLGAASGQDFTTKREKDPLLSQIFGDEQVPDVELSAIARGAEPQVLISHITNMFSFDIDQTIAGGSSPQEVADLSARAIRDFSRDAVAKSTKTAKVPFAR